MAIGISSIKINRLYEEILLYLYEGYNNLNIVGLLLITSLIELFGLSILSIFIKPIRNTLIIWLIVLLIESLFNYLMILRIARGKYEN